MNPLSGTVAAGDGVVVKMKLPTNEEVDDNVKAFLLGRAILHTH